METGLTAFANPRKGLLGRRAIHAESPFFLILPSRRATKMVADHSSLQPLEWSASQTCRGRHCREGADYREKVARIFSKSIGGWRVGLQPNLIFPDRPI